jgi:hypothetical protein
VWQVYTRPTSVSDFFNKSTTWKTILLFSGHENRPGSLHSKVPTNISKEVPKNLEFYKFEYEVHQTGL